VAEHVGCEQALELVLASLDCSAICTLAITCSQLKKAVLHGLVWKVRPHRPCPKPHRPAFGGFRNPAVQSGVGIVKPVIVKGGLLSRLVVFPYHHLVVVKWQNRLLSRGWISVLSVAPCFDMVPAWVRWLDNSTKRI
jgi:hypothetical protein